MYCEKCRGTMRPKEYKGVYGKNYKAITKKTIGKLISMVFNLKYNKFLPRSVAQPLCSSLGNYKAVNSVDNF